MARPFLSVIIPAYNEAERLPLTIIDVDRHLSEQEYSYEILAVISPSEDRTDEIMQRFSGLVKNLKVIKLDKNWGKGYAVRTGMLAAKGSRRLYMDADNSVSVVEFNKMLPYLPTGGSSIDHAFEVVVGSRLVEGSQVKPRRPWYRRLASFKIRVIIKLLGLGVVRDSQCGFKCFTAEAAEKIFPKVTTNGWMSDLEALVVAKKMGFKIKEVPIFYAHNPGTRARPQHYLSSLWDTLKIRFRVNKI